MKSFKKLLFTLLTLSAFIAQAQTISNNSLPQDTYPFDKYINKNLLYPKPDLQNGITGVVITTFNIDETYHVRNIKILKSPNANFSKSVITVLENAPATFYKNPQLVYGMAFYFEVTVQSVHKSPDETGVAEMLNGLTSENVIVLKKVNRRGFFYSD
ncbi:MAG: energy transducer TonB [Bacteroidota bacterium]